MMVVKLGGSVLTDKGAPRARFRVAVARRLSEEMAAAREAVVVVHGGGSVGHGVARRYGLRGEGPGPRVPKKRLARGALAVNRAMREMNERLSAELWRAGLTTISLPGGEVARLDDGALVSLDATPFAQALEAGLTPLTFGDAAPDATRGHAVVSGDILAWALAKRLKARKVVFVTDLDGIHSAPPGTRGARLERRVRTRDLARLASNAAATAGDVTGGMGGKLRAIRRIGRAGVPVLVVNGLRPGRLRAAVQGRAVVGTAVEP